MSPSKQHGHTTVKASRNMAILVVQIRSALNLSIKEENSSTLQHPVVFVPGIFWTSNPVRGDERV